MQKDSIQSTKLKQIGSPYIQSTVKTVHCPALSMSLILFYLFSLCFILLQWPEKKTDAQAHAKKLKCLPMPLKLHIISDAWLCLHNTLNCDLRFQNMLVLHSWRFLEDKKGIFPTDPICLKWNHFLTLPAGLQRQADLNSYQYELEI